MPRTPEHWGNRGAVSTALLPAAWTYDLAGRLRRSLVAPMRIGIPVMCIGAVEAGGSGKTPVAASLAAALRRLGHAPHILSRGYGGRLKGPARVDPARHDASDCGDEPLLLARDTPVWVGADRRASARLAMAAGADCLLLDDGLQNPRLAQDVRVLVLDGGNPFGNGRVIPAGPLREPVAAALARATHAVIMGGDAKNLAAALPARAPGLEILQARLNVPDAGHFAGRRVYGFAGIGKPHKFLATLRQVGCEIAGFQAFPDHHRFTPEEVMGVVEAAAALGAAPVTTEKDFIRLPGAARRMVETVPVDVIWDDAGDDRLARALFPG